MRSRVNICSAALVLVLSGCVNSDPAEEAATPTSISSTSEAPEQLPSGADPDESTTTSSSTSSTSEAVTTTSELTSEIETETGSDVFRIAPAGNLPAPVIMYGPDGVFHAGITGQLSQVVEGPVSSAVDTYESGIVYQRPGDDRRVFFQGADGDQELLVAADNQTIRLVGVRFDSSNDNTVHVLYVRRTSSTPERSSETLRSYNMTTGEVTEVLETGGWESGTAFSYIEGDRAVGRWSGEAFTRTHVVDVVAGEIEQGFPDQADCFDGEQADGCLPFDVATISGDTIYGFGPKTNTSGVVNQMALYAFDIATSDLNELASFPWDNGLYYPHDIWVSFDGVVVSLSTAPRFGDGEPLPALVFDTSTGEATTAPVAGYLRSGFIS